MGIPISQAITVARYVLTQRLLGRERYPLVLMLEPLFRCNLACAGCGKVQYPSHILKKNLSVEACVGAAEECGAPIVSIAGGEPLLHPDIGRIAEELVRRKRYVYLCTNALLLREKLAAGVFRPSQFLSFSVHMDGSRDEHDRSVCRDGTYDEAVAAIREALRLGFRVTTNTTLFKDAEPFKVRRFFDEMTELGVEGMMLSPGYSYSKAPQKDNFLETDRTKALFRDILRNRDRRWNFNQSPLFLKFLAGEREYECTPWGNPTFNPFGWQRPCYLLQEGYARSFRELMETTPWDNYGRRSGNPKCRDCMVHSGFEPTAVKDTFGSWRAMGETIRSTITGQL